MTLGLSVVVPLYNTPLKERKESIEALLSQTLNFPLEVILINDGTTLEELHHWGEVLAKKDPRVNYYYQENQGVSKARNQGIKLAQMDYLTFLDPDDTLTFAKDFIIPNEDFDIGYFPSYTFSTIEKTNLHNPLGGQSKVSSEKIITSILSLDEGEYSSINSFLTSVCWGKIFPTTKVKEHLFPTGINKREDVLWNLAYLKNAKKCLSVTGITYGYRTHQETSLSLKPQKNLHETYTKVCYKLKEILPEEKWQLLLKKYFYNLFHEVLVLDAFHEKNQLTEKEQQTIFYEFASLKELFPTAKKVTFKNIGKKKKLLYFALKQENWLFVKLLFQLKKR